MADVVLGAVVQNLNSLIQNEFGLIWGIEKEMKRLSSILSTIRDVLEDAEVKELKDKAIRSWLKKLKAAAYDANNILDEAAIEALELEVRSTHQSCTKQVSHFLLSSCYFKRNMLRYKLGKKITEIMRLDEISAEKSKFHLREGVVDKGIQIRERETSSIPPELEVYGRDEDKENIIQLLLNNVRNHKVLSICPIIGMGGLGKTTLAQLAYNDVRVANHFDLRTWVCISEPFDIKRLLTETIERAGGNINDLIDSALDPIQHRLRDTLSGKRFLLVLDDVWNQNQDQWDNMKCCLTRGAQGSSIIVTTRMGQVATIMGTLPAFHLTQLSEDDCWSLFKQRAFGIWREDHSNLVTIGKEIIKKCGGVPLAAKALGSLMRFKSNESEWLFVRDSELWEIDDEENAILPALRLSYNNLPSRLRQCFAYCSIFPKGYNIEKEDLIHLWMANDFIQPKGRMYLEDIGNEIFNDLLWRYFFQNIRKDDNGNITTCKMHDLVHDLASSVMVDECCIIEVGKTKDIPKNIHHLLLIFDSKTHSTPLESLLKSQLIRTLLSQSPSDEIIRNLHFIFSNLRCLRALDLSYSQFRNLPISISKLKHLRYLNLSYTNIIALPESVSSLRHLQTLKLTCCFRLQKLPKDMRKMSSLRHLDLDICFCEELTEMPIGMGQLIHMQTLSKFIVGQKSGCHVKELQELNHLKGELSIERLENVRNSMEAEEANLIRKQNLFTLGLYWSAWDGDICLQENPGGVLEGLQPPPNIRNFEIKGYGGVKFSSWMGDLSLPNLVQVSIMNCRRCEHLPPLGQLQQLKDLRIQKLDCVKCIGKEFYSGEGMVKGFPSLVELSISDMLSLEEWSKEEAGGVLPCLSELVIEDCPKLTSLSVLPSLKHLQVLRCNEVILRSLENLTCLSYLHIKEFLQMKCFPEGVLQNLTTLENMSIDSCPEMEWLPSEDMQHLISLLTLKIVSLPKLKTLPEGIRYLTSLQNLDILLCHKLKSLPEGLQHLTSLRTLKIWYCKNLKSLPNGLQHLVRLLVLEIYGCPHLEIRCQRERGEDWHKIAHIPRVTINETLQ